MDEIKLLPHEEVHDLQYKGLRIIQSSKHFRFGTDAVLLAGFSRVKNKARVCDLCTGSAVIPLLLGRRTRAAGITGIELLPEVCDMARRSVMMNGLQGLVNIVCGDIKDYETLVGKNCFDVITCNPPYGREGNIKNTDEVLAAARHEGAISLKDVIGISAALLVNHGRLCMIHQADRIADMICLMNDFGLTVKRLRLIHPFAGKPPNLMLIESVKQGNPGVNIEAPLIVYDENGEYTDDMNAIYHRKI